MEAPSVRSRSAAASSAAAERIPPPSSSGVPSARSGSAGGRFGGPGRPPAQTAPEKTVSISIGGNIIGNAEFSADVSISGRLGSFTVGGSVTGGSGDYSTLIQGDGI